MTAIVTIAGKQFNVKPSDILSVPKLDKQAGSQVVFNQVHIIQNKSNIIVGTPTVPNAKVQAQIIEHVKGKKIIVFKKKRRKGYKVKAGHRQQLTNIRIKTIINN